ncbi:MAG: Tad domain-containing protein, partial [Pirellulales bacterium]
MIVYDVILSDLRKLARVHRDERGTISIVSVFALIILAMLLGMVLNVGFQADSKVKMQNAADAAAYSGGVVMARGMNTLAFTNHLLCDVFALTAFLREATDNRGVEYVPEILAAWQDLAPQYEFDGFNRFQNWNGQYYGQNAGFSIQTLSEAITNTVPKEQEMVRAFAEWAAAFSDQVLPTLEHILDNELIPEYQRAVVENVPDIAQTAMNLIAHAHGVRPDGETHETRGPLQGMLWTPRAEPVNTFADFTNRSLPVVDPVRDAMPEQQYYLKVARAWRN